MTSKLESIWSSISIPPASLTDLEQNLGRVSLQYMRQSLELPLDHEKQAVLTRLYSAANALYQAVRKGTVENAIFEISSNLIGCEQVALLVMSRQQDGVYFIGSVELHPTRLNALRRNAKRIVEEEAPADPIFMETTSKDQPFLSSLGINACIRFTLDSAAKGAIVLFDLLPQRHSLDGGDRELLQLLSAYTGPCLAASKTRHQDPFAWMQL